MEGLLGPEEGEECQSREFLNSCSESSPESDLTCNQGSRDSTTTTRPLPIMSATHFNRGPAYGMSAEVKSKVRVAKALGVFAGVGERGMLSAT